MRNGKGSAVRPGFYTEKTRGNFEEIDWTDKKKNYIFQDRKIVEIEGETLVSTVSAVVNHQW